MTPILARQTATNRLKKFIIKLLSDNGKLFTHAPIVYLLNIKIGTNLAFAQILELPTTLGQNRNIIASHDIFGTLSG